VRMVRSDKREARSEKCENVREWRGEEKRTKRFLLRSLSFSIVAIKLSRNLIVSSFSCSCFRCFSIPAFSSSI
jgi:hypothetical protein